MIKSKGIIFLFGILLFSSLVLAQGYKMEISMTKETFKANENITFIITLYDSNNNPVEGLVPITIQDISRKEVIEKTVSSKDLVSVDLQENIAGEWTIIGQYHDAMAIESFFIIASEQVEFNLVAEVLTITNVGNIVYTPSIEITIGDTIGEIKKPKLDVGESVTYRLIAPEGVYKIKVVDKNNPESAYTQGNVQLSGKGFTGKAIGILDEQAQNRNALTGGISPDQNSDDALLTYLRDSKFVYVFILLVFGAMILLAIERRYKKRVHN